MNAPDEPRPRIPAIRVWARGAGAAAASALLALLAFPPLDLWPLALVAPLPLLWAAGAIGGRRVHGALAVTVGTAPLWAWNEQWMFGVSAVGAPLLVLYLSAWSGLLVWFTSWVAERARLSVWLVGPIAWSGLEFLRGNVVLGGYPWLLAGHPTIGWLWAAGAGAVVGACGVTLLTVGVSGAIGAIGAGRGRRRLRGVFALVGVLACWAALSSLAHPRTAGSLRVTLVQTSVPQSIRHGWQPPDRVGDLDRMLELTIEACQAEPRPDLVVWPETMFPGDFLDPVSLAEERSANLYWLTPPGVRWPALHRVVWLGPEGTDEPVEVRGPIERRGLLTIPTTVAADSLLTWQSRLDVPLLIGSDGIEGLSVEVRPDGSVRAEWDKRFNSSFLLREGRVQPSRYDKMHLTPFGEVMPVISRWPWLESTLLRVGVGARGMTFDLESGAAPVVHKVPGVGGEVRVATPICFEGVMSGVCRKLVYDGGRRRADVLVQMTNEGWFGDFDGGRLQHLQAVRWRAVELGTPIARAANTGISAVIDARGGLEASGVPGGRSNVDGLLAADLPLGVGATPYATIGDAAGWLSAATLLALACLAAIRTPRQRPGRRTAEIERE